MKTIKQIADEIGVSKTAVRKRITEEVKTKFAETVSGVIYILPEGECIIRQGFERISPQTRFPEVSANQIPLVSSEVPALISMLQRELDIKNEQIRDLNTRLAETTAALLSEQQSAQAAQALHAGTITKQLADGTAPAFDRDPPEMNFIERVKFIFSGKRQTH